MSNSGTRKDARLSMDQVISNRTLLIVTALTGLILLWFYGLEPRFGAGRQYSALVWLTRTWDAETDYEHGFLVPIVMVGLIIYKWKVLKAAVGEGRYIGLAAVFIGALLYVAAYRTIQPRLAVGGLPFILWGSACCLWGFQVAKILTFPLFFLWLAVPLPSFQQATTHLQLLATFLAHHGSSLFGVDTIVEGTSILPVKGDWKPLEIAHGCSGIRSLMALLMISAAWAYVAKIKLWQKVVLFLAAFPLAIIGNAMRVTSIFVIAEYGDEKWASGTWHDWSGMLLFYPFSLFLLLLLHSAFEGGIPWRNKKKIQTRKIQSRKFVPEQTDI